MGQRKGKGTRDTEKERNKDSDRGKGTEKERDIGKIYRTETGIWTGAGTE